MIFLENVGDPDLEGMNQSKRWASPVMWKGQTGLGAKVFISPVLRQETEV